MIFKCPAKYSIYHSRRLFVPLFDVTFYYNECKNITTGCIANSIMYVSGGYKGPYRGHLDNLWSYNSRVDAWVEHKPMNHARSYHSMAPSSHDKIIVVGGVNYLTATDTFEDVRVKIYSQNLCYLLQLAGGI